MSENMIMTMDDNEAMVMELTQERTVSYCSMKADTKEDKAKLFNAMNNPEKRLKDMVNMTINVKDVFVEIVQCVNQETREVKNAPRIVLIDDEGVGYQCVSIGIFSALKKMFQIYGAPTWEDPIKMKISLINKGKDRSILTINPVVE